MKRLFLLSAAILVSTVTMSQSNNPKNQLGADIVAAGQAISKDYKEGKLKDFSQATIDEYYKRLMPKYPSVPIADINKILNSLKGATNESVIKNSGLSAEAKSFLKKSLTDYSTTQLVDDVLKSKIPQGEKDIVLTVLAMNYNLIPIDNRRITNPVKSKGPNVSFDINFDDSSFDVAERDEVVLWGALGAIQGWYFCGPWCAVVGGIIGIIIGSSAGNTTVTPGNGGNPYGNGHPQP
jgi:hypothetical protein